MIWDGTFPSGFFGPKEGSLVLRNLGGVVTGRLNEPVMRVAGLRVEAGKIVSLGDEGEADIVVDARGAVAIPGLIDTHCHVVFADWTPRQHTIGFLESYMHGGVTMAMSPSEVHLPGRPTDPIGVKALAITAQRAYASFRPGGLKVLGGSLICEPGLQETDLQELVAAGVRLMKVGFGAFTRPTDATSLVSLARSMGFLVMSHSGGASIPGSSPVTVADLLKIKPDIAGHINGGTTSLPDEDLIELIETSEIVLQIVQAGNLRSALFILNEARARGALDRVILGTDTPSGTGVMPLGMIKSVVELASLGDLTPTDAIALATGNAGRILRVQEGVIEIGRPADIVLIQHPLGCARSDPLGAMENGDIPGISGVLIDGEIRALRSRNSPAPAREAAVEAQSSWQRLSD